jgi:hypothetical protein
LASCSDDESPTASDRPVITETSIEILEITPEPGSVVSAEDSIVAKVAYQVAEDDQCESGYIVSLLFRTYSGFTCRGIAGECAILTTKDSGTMTFTYPLQRVWNVDSVRRPLLVHFDLVHRCPDSTDPLGIYLAWTETVVYAEEE